VEQEAQAEQVARAAQVVPVALVEQVGPAVLAVQAVRLSARWAMPMPTP